jgi:hypothetical protein
MALPGNEQFLKDGYVVVKNIIPEPDIKQLRELILKNIKECVEQLNMTEDNYLSVVSRWANPSPVTSNLPSFLLDVLSKTTEEIIGSIPSLNKLNIICKNEYCSGPVPYHQDISYSPHEPYQLSSWLAIHDVEADSGPLEVIPGSHLDPITSAVDFWSPDYVDNLVLKKHAKPLSISAGDVVFFDSRLWHGSSESLSLTPRFALVSRWTVESWQQKKFIPPIDPKHFGMWTCGDITHQILSEGLKVLFNKVEEDFLYLIDAWIKILEHAQLPFVVNTNQSLKSLHKIKILHLAYMHHNGGDATGVLYKSLWKTFLSPLKNHLDLTLGVK